MLKDFGEISRIGRSRLNSVFYLEIISYRKTIDGIFAGPLVLFGTAVSDVTDRCLDYTEGIFSIAFMQPESQIPILLEIDTLIEHADCE
jgi:hypothetical protein